MGPAATGPRVLIDCTAIPAERRGVGRYVEGLISGLHADDAMLTLVAQARDRDQLAADAPHATVISLSAFMAYRPLRIIWEQIGLPLLARRLRTEVLHSPHYTFPVLWRGGRVVTVHDETFFSDSHLHTPLKRVFFRQWLRAAWRWAHVVITPSASTASAVASRLGPARGTVRVAHLGVDPRRFGAPSEARITEFREHFGIAAHQTWFAFLGTIEPRKNLPALLDAYAEVRATLGDAAPIMLISGGRGWDADAAARLDALAPGSGVHELGYVEVHELTALLGGAIAVLYPSLGEGFGLPVLEAMACGATVVTTNRLALPEVGGQAVFYAEPTAEALAAAMLQLADDDELRAELSSRALVQAGLFSWAATARTHAAAYRTARERG